MHAEEMIAVDARISPAVAERHRLVERERAEEQRRVLARRVVALGEGLVRAEAEAHRELVPGSLDDADVGGGERPFDEGAGLADEQTDVRARQRSLTQFGQRSLLSRATRDLRLSGAQPFVYRHLISSPRTSHGMQPCGHKLRG
jgi:hypothetical protein